MQAPKEKNPKLVVEMVFKQESSLTIVSAKTALFPYPRVDGRLMFHLFSVIIDLSTILTQESCRTSLFVKPNSFRSPLRTPNNSTFQYKVLPFPCFFVSNAGLQP